MSDAQTSRFSLTVTGLMGLLICFFAVIFMKEITLPYIALPLVFLACGILLRRKGLSVPEIAMYLLTAYLPFSKKIGEEFGHFGSAFNFVNLLMAVFLLSWAWKGLKRRDWQWQSNALMIPMLLFVLIGVFSIAGYRAYGAEYIKEASVQFLQTWIIPLVLFVLVFHTVRDRGAFKNIVLIMMFAVAVVSFLAVYEYQFNTGGGDMDESRVGILTDDPNLLGAFIVFYMFFPLAFVFMNWRRRICWTMMIPFLISCRAVMVTFSRGAYLALVFAVFAMAFFRKKWLFLVLVLLAWFAVANPYLLPGGIRYRMGQTVKTGTPDMANTEALEGSLDPSAGKRIEVWQAAVRMIRTHPVFGVGYALFLPKVQHYWTLPSSMDAHNTYLLIAVEMGVPALVLFLWMLLVLFWNGRKVYRETQDPFVKAIALGFLGGLISFLVCNFFVTHLHVPEVAAYFWVLAALMMRMVRDG